KTIGASTVLKGAATFAVVAALGVGAAGEGGLIHVGLPGDGGSASTSSAAARSGGEGAGVPASATDGTGVTTAPQAKPDGEDQAKVGTAAAIAGGTAA